MKADDLNRSIQYVKGVGPRRVTQLAKLGVHTVAEALNFFPRGYEDRSVIRKIKDLRVGERATLRVRVVDVEVRRTRKGRDMARVLFEDDTDTIEAVWFNTRYWSADRFEHGRELLVTGKVDSYDGLQLVSPQCEPVGSQEGFGDAVLPQYPLTEDLSQWVVRKVMRRVVDEYADLIEEFLPRELLEARGFLNINDAYRNIHFPETGEMARLARKRLIYSEFLLLELGMALRRRRVRREDKGCAFDVTEAIDRRIRKRFPFTLTPAQERVITEIREDMRAPLPMNRLLQGDVGSGKTAVALYALLVAVANGRQAAIMAPTEVLAEQHMRTFGEYLKGSRVRIERFTGGARAAERREGLARLAAGEIDIAVGTHALVQSDVEFKDLGLVVVDEQHKFGVLQRAELRRKGRHPDVLVMTATPIPRTLALTVFGDLDTSILDEMPPGRRPAQTRLGATELERRKTYDFIRRRLADGEQAFIVYPLVEETDKSELQAATQEAERLQAGEFRDYEVGLLHGRMKPEEKDRIMRAFRDGEIRVLVSTVVIEVGVDVPAASVMVVEHAERFGLAQLHQLRGRIGRSADTRQAWFIMFSDSRGEDTTRRLQVIVDTTDGFRIAEEDLRIRGPGEFFGPRQHGLPDLIIGDLVEDVEALLEARRDAFGIVAEDADLSAHPLLKQKMEAKYAGKLELIRVG